MASPVEQINKAIFLHQQGNLADAEAIYKKVLRGHARNFDALHMLGIINAQRGAFQEAEKLLRKALSVDQKVAPCFHNYGTVLAKLKRFEDAVRSYDSAIALTPNHAPIHSDRGNALYELKRYDEALAAYDRALALKYNFADAWVGRGNVFCDLKRHDEAFAAYDKALVLQPDLANAWLGRGHLFRDLKRHAEAFAAYDRAMALNPDLVGVESSRLFFKMHLCDWNHIDAEYTHLISSVRNGNENTIPFVFLAIPSSPDEQLRCAKLWVANKCPPSDKPIWQGERYNHNRIRVAYLSADFRQHVVSTLIVGMFECHDKSHFDVSAISFGSDDNSELRHRLEASVEHFIDVKTQSDEQIARLVRSLEIDVLVDLMGLTQDSRPNIFARRPAPIQVNFLGYLGTMGAPYIDYMIADRTVIPENQREFYSEKIVYLPNCFQPTDQGRLIAEKSISRAEANLPQQGFVFCSFNANYKITPAVYDSWMRILKQVDGSVMWLVADNPTAERNLRNEAVARGVNAERLIFAPRISLAEHQARLRLADLFLDTLPYNAGATASDTLWAGVPILTCLGDTFVGRMAASVLNSIGLPELITTTPEAYEALAIDLATDPKRMTEIKLKLAKNRLTMPLFDTKLFTKHIEAAYTEMYKRDRAENIYVAG